MKVIDILNKIANKEELPKKISINDYVLYDEYTIWTLEDGCYGRDITGEEERQFLFEYLTTNMLNDEVEIIEDTLKDKKIEKFYFSVYQDQKLGGREVIEPLETKINEIIDKINGDK